MRTVNSAPLTTAIMTIVFLASVSSGQTTRPATRPAERYANSTIVTRMMVFDVNHTGNVTRDEVTDDRLLPLFDQADVNHTGVITKDDLMALAAKLDAQGQRNGGFGGGPGGRGGPGGAGGFGGPGGPPEFGFGPMDRPFAPPSVPSGQILPPSARDSLKLSDDQKSEVNLLQAEVNQKLASILTAAQRQQLEQMNQNGPGFGPPTGQGFPPR